MDFIIITKNNTYIILIFKIMKLKIKKIEKTIKDNHNL